MTFLQYLCVKLLGPPVRSGAPGESYWLCPLHNDHNPSFHTLPHKPEEYRDYWKCFGCGRGGDDYQLLRDLRDFRAHPMTLGNWPVHERLLARLRGHYDRLVAKGDGLTVAPKPQPQRPSRPHAFLPSVETVETRKRYLQLAEAAWRDMTEEQRDWVLAVDELIRHQHDVDITTLAAVGREIKACAEREECELREHIRRGDEAHLAGCTDPECDAICCRRKAQRVRAMRDRLAMRSKNGTRTS
jgi:hypothetical protein